MTTSNFQLQCGPHAASPDTHRPGRRPSPTSPPLSDVVGKISGKAPFSAIRKAAPVITATLQHANPSRSFPPALEPPSAPQKISPKTPNHGLKQPNIHQPHEQQQQHQPTADCPNSARMPRQTPVKHTCQDADLIKIPAAPESHSESSSQASSGGSCHSGSSPILKHYGIELSAERIARGVTPVMAAAAAGNLRATMALLHPLASAHPNPKAHPQLHADNNGRTALHHAADSPLVCSMDIIFALLAVYGYKSVFARDKCGASPLHLLAKRKSPQHQPPPAPPSGAKVSTRGDVCTMLSIFVGIVHAAASNQPNSPPIPSSRSKFSVGLGPSCCTAAIDLLDHNGRTPLHFAAGTGCTACIGTLLAAGADPTVRESKYSMQPQDVAREGRHLAATALLAPQSAPNSPVSNGSMGNSFEIHSSSRPTRHQGSPTQRRSPGFKNTSQRRPGGTSSPQASRTRSQSHRTPGTEEDKSSMSCKMHAVIISLTDALTAADLPSPSGHAADISALETVYPNRSKADKHPSTDLLLNADASRHHMDSSKHGRSPPRDVDCRHCIDVSSSAAQLEKLSRLVAAVEPVVRERDQLKRELAQLKDILMQRVDSNAVVRSPSHNMLLSGVTLDANFYYTPLTPQKPASVPSSTPNTSLSPEHLQTHVSGKNLIDSMCSAATKVAAADTVDLADTVSSTANTSVTQNPYGGASGGGLARMANDVPDLVIQPGRRVFYDKDYQPSQSVEELVRSLSMTDNTKEYRICPACGKPTSDTMATHFEKHHPLTSHPPDTDALPVTVERIMACAEEIINRFHEAAQPIPLSRDQALAVAVYTLETEIYRRMNSAMRSGDQTEIGFWAPMIYHLTSALGCLQVLSVPTAANAPAAPSTVSLFRALDSKVDPKYYQAGDIVTWQAFTSATRSASVVVDFLGRNVGTLFILTAKTACPIFNLSVFPSEQEWLFAPNTRFEVTGRMSDAAQGLLALSLACDLSHVVVYELNELSASQVIDKVRRRLVARGVAAGDRRPSFIGSPETIDTVVDQFATAPPPRRGLLGFTAPLFLSPASKPPPGSQTHHHHNSNISSRSHHHDSTHSSHMSSGTTTSSSSDNGPEHPDVLNTDVNTDDDGAASNSTLDEIPDADMKDSASM